MERHTFGAAFGPALHMVIDQHELVRMGDICGLVPSGQCACDGHRDRLLICVAAVWLATTIRHMAGELDQRGWMDHAHICLMGDHGEDFSDRCFMHHDSVVEGAVHVPIAFTSPDLPICRTDDAIVRTIDILPTLPDLSGIEAPSGLDGTCLNRRMRQKTPLDLVAKGEAFLYRQKDAVLDAEVRNRRLDLYEQGVKRKRTSVLSTGRNRRCNCLMRVTGVGS